MNTLAKLLAYGLSKDAHFIAFNYLFNTKQRVKINNTFSSWTELILVVPQDSVRGHLLFHIYIYNLFQTLKNTDVCNFLDGTTPYVNNESLGKVSESFEQKAKLTLSCIML